MKMRMFYLKSEIHGNRAENAGKEGDAGSCTERGFRCHFCFRLSQQELTRGVGADEGVCTLGRLQGDPGSGGTPQSGSLCRLFLINQHSPTGNKLDPTSGFIIG